MQLFSYWESSSAWRVRIALALKGIDYTCIPVDLRRAGGGEQHEAGFETVNPLRQVPVLEWVEEGSKRRLGQSMAIVELLEEQLPEPPLLPDDPFLRARARQLAEIVNAGVQPLQNTYVLGKVREGGGDDHAWAAHFITRGLRAMESLARETAGTYLVGDTVTIADVFLVPQMYNARRYGADLDGLDTLLRSESACAALEAFQRALPERQPDAQR